MLRIFLMAPDSSIALSLYQSKGQRLLLSCKHATSSLAAAAGMAHRQPYPGAWRFSRSIVARSAVKGIAGCAGSGWR